MKCDPSMIVFWLAASDKEREGTWLWYAARQPVKYSNFGRGEPANTTGEDCLALTKFDNFAGWHDDLCTHTGYFICEKQANSIDPGFVVG